MSNFDDYDFNRESRGPRRTSGSSRTTRQGRPSGQRRASGQGRASYRNGYGSSSLQDLDVELYEDEDFYTSDRRAGAAERGRSSRSAGSHSGSGRSSAGRSSSNRSSGNAQRRRPPQKSGRGSKAAKRKKTRRTIIVVEVVILIILALVFFLWNKFGKVNWDNINMEKIEVNNLDEQTEEVLSNYTTIALFGVDNRSNGNLDSGNSDAIILVSINNDSKEVKMVSVQRDTYLQISEGTYRKCNYAYNHGGVEKALEMLNTNLDLKIDGYVSVDFYALAKIVDDLGGLDLEITSKMISTNNPETGQNALAGYIAEVENVLNYYPSKEDGWDINDCYFSSPGTYHLNGAQVVGYCRNRYAVDNDYGRAENQRTVIKLIVEKAKSANVSQLNKIADDVFPKIATSLSLSQCLGMATSVGDYSIGDSSGFPFALKTKTVSKKTGSVVVPCTLTTNVVQLHKFLYNQDDYDPTDDKVDVISDHIQSETGLSESSAEITQETD